MGLKNLEDMVTDIKSLSLNSKGRPSGAQRRRMRIEDAIAEGRPVYSRRHMKRIPGASKLATGTKLGWRVVAKRKESRSGKKPQAAPTHRITGTQMEAGSRVGGGECSSVNKPQTTPPPGRPKRTRGSDNYSYPRGG